MYNIYRITNDIDGKSYIGQTKRESAVRAIEHKFKPSKGRSSLINNAILEFGITNFSIKTLEQCEDILADEREQYWIEFYDTTNPEKGYNKAKGGRGNPGLPVSRETREKLRLKNKGFSKEAREAKKISATGVPVSDKVAELNRTRGKSKSVAIVQYSVSGKFINEFESIIEASRATHTDRRTIQRQLKGEYAMNGSGRSTSNIKFIWKLKD